MTLSPMLYFGCVARPGHYLHGPDLQQMRRDPPDFPVSLRHRSYPGPNLDGKFCDKDNRTEGRARVHHVDGWTILAFWDYSIDKRGGSNSVFLVPGTYEFGCMAEMARTTYPSVWGRFTFTVYDGWPQQRRGEADTGPDHPRCMADNDGDCTWHHCPQLRDGEPHHTGRHCPLDKRDPDDDV